MQEAGQWIRSAHFDMDSIIVPYETTTDTDDRSNRKRKASHIGASATTTTTEKTIPPPGLLELIRKNDEKWEDHYQKLKTFTENVADGDPNLVHHAEYNQMKLSAWLRAQKMAYVKYKNGVYNTAEAYPVDREGRFLKLFELGVTFRSDDSPGSWNDQAKKWRAFTQGDPNKEIPSDCTADPALAGLAEWKERQIRQYCKLMRGEQPHEMFPHRLSQLQKLKFPFPENVDRPRPSKKRTKKFDDRFQEFIDWKEKHGHGNVPQSAPELGSWVKSVREDYQKLQDGLKPIRGLTEERVQRLKDAGFVFRLRKVRKNKPPPKPVEPEEPKRSAFDDRMEEFLRWKEDHPGKTWVPKSRTGLGNWAGKMRSEYRKHLSGKPSRFTKDQYNEMRMAGFDFRPDRGLGRPRKDEEESPETAPSDDPMEGETEGGES